MRLNEQNALNILQNISYTESGVDVLFSINNKEVWLSQIEAVWFRRGGIMHYSNIQCSQYTSESVFYGIRTILNFLKSENNALTDFVLYSLKNKKSIGDPKRYNINKLIVLNEALKVGLKIPYTLVTKDKNYLKAKMPFNNLITKTIQDALPIRLGEYRFASGVQALNKSEINCDFYYSKFQNRINKRYELRIFFIGKAFYSCAIFSQANEKTKIDFRNYDNERPNYL